MTAVIESSGTAVASPLGCNPPAASPADALRWSRFLAATEAEGPGCRAAIWVQGCSVHCPGCFNPHMWAPRGAIVTDPTELATDWIAQALAAGSRGVTLLGGEPFDQAAALAPIAEAFTAAGLGVMAFSGYRYDDLRAWSASRADIAALLASTDLLCDGPYLREYPDQHRPWIGSTNQSIRALTPRYEADVQRIIAAGRPDTLEVRIRTDGTVQVNGWATDDALATLFDDLGVRADRPQERVA